MSTKIARGRNIVCCAMLFAAALLWGFASFGNNNPSYQVIGMDNGIFLCMGRGIAQGLTPYVDITENKGPLFFLLMALPQMLVKGTVGVYVLEVLLLLGNCAMIWFGARWLAGRGRGMLSSAVAMVVYLGSTAISNNFCEEYDLFFTLAGVTVMIHAYTDQRRGAGWRSFILGVCTAAIMLIKASDILGLGVTVLFYIAYVVRQRKGFWREALKYIAGLAFIAVPVFAYLWRVNAVGPMIKEYFLNNFVYVASAKDINFWEMRRYLLTSSFGTKSLIPVALMLAAAVIYRLCRIKCKDLSQTSGPLWGYAFAFALANLLTAYVAGTVFYQHLVMGVSTKILACLLGVGALTRLADQKLPWFGWLQTAAALCLCLVIAVPKCGALTADKLQSAAEQRESRFAAELSFQEELVDYETVYLFGVTPEWYWINDRQPAFRYYNPIGFIVDNVGNDLEYEIEDFMLETGADALILADDVEEYRGVLTHATIDEIQENYELVMEDDQGRLLLRRL